MAGGFVTVFCQDLDLEDFAEWWPHLCEQRLPTCAQWFAWLPLAKCGGYKLTEETDPYPCSYANLILRGRTDWIIVTPSICVQR